MDTKDVEQLLRMAAKQQHDEEAFEAEIDAILRTTPEVTLSADFRERALKAMQEAQAKRMQSQKPD